MPNKNLSVRDHSVSGEVFELIYDKERELLYTFPKPEGAKLASYYESEDYISHTDGTRSLFEKAYQSIKKIALKNKLSLLNKLHPSKGKLLDIGAGTGDFLATAQADGWQVSGIEPNEKARNSAISKSVFLVNDTKELKDNSFDIITMWHVLEHVPDLDAQVAEIKRLLKPEGTIIIAVPNHRSYDAQHYGEFWAAYDVPRHLWHFSKPGIAKLFSKYDFTLVKVLPMWFDVFYVSLLSEKYKTGRMNPAKAFLNGLKSNWKGKKSGEFSSHIYLLKAQ